MNRFSDKFGNDQSTKQVIKGCIEDKLEGKKNINSNVSIYFIIVINLLIFYFSTLMKFKTILNRCLIFNTSRAMSIMK